MTPTAHDISVESWRKYTFTDPQSGERVEHLIEKPRTLYLGRTSHRVVDSEGITHLVPSVGQFGCIVTFEGEVVL